MAILDSFRRRPQEEEKHYIFTFNNKLKNANLKEENKVDSLVKVLSPLIPVITIIIGVLQFQVQQRYTQEQEFKRQLWSKRLEAYTQISELVSSLYAAVNRRDKHKFDSLSLHYDEVYLSKVPLFDYDSVEYRMEKFNNELYDFRKGEGDTMAFRRKSYKLIKICMRSLKNSKIELINDSEISKKNVLGHINSN